MNFEPDKPFETDKPTVEVDPMTRGRHRFRLVVMDDKRRTSKPVDFIVTVLPPPINPVPP